MGPRTSSSSIQSNGKYTNTAAATFPLRLPLSCARPLAGAMPPSGHSTPPSPTRIKALRCYGVRAPTTPLPPGAAGGTDTRLSFLRWRIKQISDATNDCYGVTAIRASALLQLDRLLKHRLYSGTRVNLRRLLFKERDED